MKTKITNGLSCLLLAAISCTTISCSNEEVSSELSASIYPKSITIDLPAKQQSLIYIDEIGSEVLPLLKGEKIALLHTILPEDVTKKEVSWTSTDSAIVTVDSDGNVEALSGDGKGYAILQVAPSVFYSGSGIYSVLKVVVSNTLVKAEEIKIETSSTEVFAGETLQLSASIKPSTSTYKTVKWSSSNEEVATVDNKGVVTGQASKDIQAKVIITATSLDGSEVYDDLEITVNQIVQPEEVMIDQIYSVSNDYLCAIGDKKITLSYTTIPEISTLSLIEWSSSNDAIATVKSGVVTFNQVGNFGDVVITALCPETKQSSSITLRLEEGLVRELFHNENNITWDLIAAHKKNGGTSTWSDGKLHVTTYAANATAQRGDFGKNDAKIWLNSTTYPLFAIRMTDVVDDYGDQGVNTRNINFDGGSSDGIYKGNLGGNNNKWESRYKLDDGSYVFIYNLSTQPWNAGGVMNGLVEFTSLQFKYADIKTIATTVHYDVFWVQTFKSDAELKAFVAAEGRTIVD